MIRIKAVLWDFDGTLVNGTLVEGKVTLKDTSYEVLKQIHKLNVMNIICSKNDKTKLIKKLEEFKLMKYIDDVYASFEPKHYMVKDILEKYKLNPYDCLFIDDLTINRKEVGYLTNVHVDYEATPLIILKYFDTSRLILQLQQTNRIEEERKFKGDFKDFIQQSNLKVTIRPAIKEDLSRITTMCNRTNEHNATRNRFTDNEVKKIFSSDDYLIFIAEAEDRYGKYGKIAEIMIRLVSFTEWMIDDFAVSCRIWSRGVGSQLMQYIIDKAKECSITKIKGIVIRNDDNASMPKLYKKFGFKIVSDVDDRINYELLIN